MSRMLGPPALVLAAALLLTGVAWAEDGTAGTTYLDPFAIGVGAGPAGMAAYTAAPGGLWSLTYNPAGVAGITRMKLGVSQILWIDETSFSYASFGMPLGEGALALGLAYFDMGSVPVTDDEGTDQGESASASDLGFIGGYGFAVPNVDNLVAGVSGHVIQASLDEESATAIGVNLGALYGLMDDQVHVGVAIKNFGTKVTFVEEEDEQTLTFAGGVSYVTVEDQIPNVDLVIGLDAIMPKDQGVQVAVGGEIWVYDVLALRAGYRTGTEMGNLSFGAGFQYSDFQLDYTFTGYEDFDAMHRISFTMAFGE